MPTYQVINGKLVDIWASEGDRAHAQNKHVYEPDEIRDASSHLWSWSTVIADGPEQAELIYLGTCAKFFRQKDRPDKALLSKALRTGRFPVRRICC